MLSYSDTMPLIAENTTFFSIPVMFRSRKALSRCRLGMTTTSTSQASTTACMSVVTRSLSLGKLMLWMYLGLWP